MKKNLLYLFIFLLSAVAFYYSNEYGWMAWIAPFPILIIGKRLSGKYLFLGAAFSYWAGAMSWWKAESFVVDLPLFLGYHLVYALVFSLIMVWVRKTSIVWLFPLGWTAFEFLFATFSQEGTWASLAYTQTNYLFLMQNVSIFGIYGVIFLVCMFPASLAYLLQRKIWNQAAVIQALFIICLLLVASFWGFFRTNTIYKGSVVSIGLTAANYTVPYEESKDSAKNIAFMKAYMTHVTQLAEQGAKIVVLPEKLVFVTSADQTAMEAILSKSAADNHVYLEVGIKLKQGKDLYNKAWIFAPSGQKVIDYAKVHMVTGLEEGFISGQKPAYFNDFSQFIGTAICKDLDFPQTIRAYGRLNIGTLLVPAWDWKGSERIHSRMAVVRGIENGFAVVRPSKEGLVTVSDRYGHITAEQSTFDQADVAFVANVPTSPQLTLYSRFGDWFGWLIVVGTFLAICLTFIRRKKHSLN
jgi:apolipoprotein N-acyltransferase